MAVDDTNLRTQLIRQLIRSEVSTFVNRLYLLFARNYDIEWPKQGRGIEDISPNEITVQQRDSLASLVNKTADGLLKDASPLLQQINSRLRASVDISYSNGLPLDEVLSLCDDLASCHLGINFSVSIIRGGAPKRKREDRQLAFEIAKQTEEQMIAAVNSERHSYLACVSLAAAALFTQCITGCPVPAHGKLVPQLAAWITKQLAKPPPSNSASYVSAINWLRESKAVDKLNSLIEIVMLEAKHDHESEFDEEKKRTVVENLVSIASGCIKAMQSNSPFPATQS